MYFFNHKLSLLVTVLLLGYQPGLHAYDIKERLNEYQSQGAGEFDANRGEKMWNTEHPASEGPPRSCALCHGADLTQSGKHVKTKKTIEPLAPSANPERLTEPAKIEKWFKRNCKWTLNRECTPQEKGDFLLFISK